MRVLQFGFCFHIEVHVCLKFPVVVGSVSNFAGKQRIKHFKEEKRKIIEEKQPRYRIINEEYCDAICSVDAQWMRYDENTLTLIKVISGIL